MDEKNTKWVMVIDEDLPLGLIANTAAVLGITLGKLFPEGVGEDVFDKEGNRHPGITRLPIPILRASATTIKELKEKLYQPEYAGLTVIDFSNVAQTCNAYERFAERLADMQEIDLKYLGIAICGDKKPVNKLTGSMPLLR